MVISAIWLMIPAYAANNCATLLGGGSPLDSGRNFPDGKRWLGDHKTVRGFVLGTLGGIFVGAGQLIIAPYLAIFTGANIIPALLPAAIVALPLGALIGDAVKSFFKRRIGVPSGAMLPVADQLDFVLGAWALCFLAAPAWFIDTFSLQVLIVIIIVTIPLQLIHNLIAVALGKKKVPW